MKKKIVFTMVLFMAFAGSYIYTTNAASNAENSMPKFIKKPSDQTVPPGGTIKIEAIVRGTPTPEVRWYKENRRIYNNDRTTISTDSTGKATLTIVKAKQEDEGIYEIKAENIIGMVDTTCTVRVSKKR
ncbi:immunoglobulin domain-containing protein [Gabonibacter chumensis]|uniref:immunoglobulin domain-containing protein n=1 Tax=Gabonibacter chumensis TaxID=2972474 RepID=UPI0025725AF5|nr:immunoglobulin domain-containing protein [Gabonibacter chumensis]MCR9012864.1 immunoglobulin domain-containing protein [Gabonibacter chumensis]